MINYPQTMVTMAESRVARKREEVKSPRKKTTRFYGKFVKKEKKRAIKAGAHSVSFPINSASDPIYPSCLNSSLLNS